jgi:predicted 3-demethylubiquinone-9 3-methyltransferase (glyoxalase superfamily)
MSEFSTFLWFDNQAEQAASFYTTLFRDAKMKEVSRYGQNNHSNEGSVMTVSFLLFGHEFVALNGGPVYQHTPATSFMIQCEDQAELDHYWDALCEGGETMQCGWVTDRFGVTWQIVPKIMFELMNDKDPQKAYRVTQAMLKMVKLDIEGLQNAYHNRV